MKMPFTALGVTYVIKDGLLTLFLALVEEFVPVANDLTLKFSTHSIIFSL